MNFDNISRNIFFRETITGNLFEFKTLIRMLPGNKSTRFFFLREDKSQLYEFDNRTINGEEPLAVQIIIYNIPEEYRNKLRVISGNLIFDGRNLENRKSKHDFNYIPFDEIVEASLDLSKIDKDSKVYFIDTVLEIDDDGDFIREF